MQCSLLGAPVPCCGRFQIGMLHTSIHSHSTKCYLKSVRPCLKRLYVKRLSYDRRLHNSSFSFAAENVSCDICVPINITVTKCMHTNGQRPATIGVCTPACSAVPTRPSSQLWADSGTLTHILAQRGTGAPIAALMAHVSRRPRRLPRDLRVRRRSAQGLIFAGDLGCTVSQLVFMM